MTFIIVAHRIFGESRITEYGIFHAHTPIEIGQHRSIRRMQTFCCVNTAVWVELIWNTTCAAICNMISSTQCSLWNRSFELKCYFNVNCVPIRIIFAIVCLFLLYIFLALWPKKAHITMITKKREDTLSEHTLQLWINVLFAAWPTVCWCVTLL